MWPDGRALLNSAVFVYAMGQPARAEASLAAVQEVVHQRWRRTELRRALELFAMSDRLQLRDAVHAATALLRGVPVIISPDDDFDDVDGLIRLDPHDAAARGSSRGGRGPFGEVGRSFECVSSGRPAAAVRNR